MDPLFKKASADFDEGGARGLLLNHLMIDSHGRIVFDSSDDSGDVTVGKNNKATADDGDGDASAAQAEDGPTRDDEAGVEDGDDETLPIDLASLGQRFFHDLTRLDELDVCPSLKTFDLGNPSGFMDIPFLKAPEDWRMDQDKDRSGNTAGDKSGMLIDEEAPAGFDDDGLGLGAFDVGEDMAFGEGGEAWAREAALDLQMRVFDAGMGEDGDGEGFDDKAEYVVSMADPRSADKMHEDILGFFDQALQKNWSSAEHWMIRKVKDVNKPASDRRRREKEPFEIDFAGAVESTVTDAVHTQAASNAAISMPKKDWKSKSRNLLPDKHFNSKSLLSLFLKPRARMAAHRRTGFGAPGGAGGAAPDDQPMDEAFWAQRKGPEETALPGGDYDANFFQDDGLPFPGGDDDDAREHLSPGIEGEAAMAGMAGLTLGGETYTFTQTMGAFGSTLVTQTRRVRPEYVQYARRAKKVDVRRLKEEMWKSMALDYKLEVRSCSPRAHIPPPLSAALADPPRRAGPVDAAAGPAPDAARAGAQPQVQRGHRRPAGRLPKGRHGRNLDVVLLHLPAAPGQRAGPRHRQERGPDGAGHSQGLDGRGDRVGGPCSTSWRFFWGGVCWLACISSPGQAGSFMAGDGPRLGELGRISFPIYPEKREHQCKQ